MNVDNLVIAFQASRQTHFNKLTILTLIQCPFSYSLTTANPMEVTLFYLWDSHLAWISGISTVCTRVQKRQLKFLSLIKVLTKTHSRSRSWWFTKKARKMNCIAYVVQEQTKESNSSWQTNLGGSWGIFPPLVKFLQSMLIWKLRLANLLGMGGGVTAPHPSPLIHLNVLFLMKALCMLKTLQIHTLAIHKTSQDYRVLSVKVCWASKNRGVLFRAPCSTFGPYIK